MGDDSDGRAADYNNSDGDEKNRDVGGKLAATRDQA